MIYHNMAQLKKTTYTYSMYIFEKTYLSVTKYIIINDTKF